MKNIQKGTRRTAGLPGLMAGNVVSALSARLQEVTERFRKEQGHYLKCESDFASKLLIQESSLSCYFRTQYLIQGSPKGFYRAKVLIYKLLFSENSVR